MADKTTPAEKPLVERRLTPEYKAALNRYIPITTDPIDRFTPAYLRTAYPPEKWPIIHIRKPGSLDMIADLEREAAAEASPKAPAAEASPSPTEDGVGGAVNLSKAQVAALGRQAVVTWKERVLTFENMTAYNGSMLAFEAENGKITDACLNLVPWQTLLDVHFRYNALFGLTDLERESLGSQPASA